DIEELEIEEDTLVRGQQVLAQRETVAAIKELVADLEEVGGAIEGAHDRFGLPARVHVEGDDQRSGHGRSPIYGLMPQSVARCKALERALGARNPVAGARIDLH